MKLKRFLCLCLALCMVFSLSLPAFALEGEETGSEPSETPVEVTEGEEVTELSDEPTEPSETPVGGTEVETPTEPSDEPTEPSDEPTEPSETPTEPVVTPIVPSLDGATVNVSDESIEAIADAVMMASEPSYTYAYQYHITGPNGTDFVIDTDTPNLLSDYYVYSVSGKYMNPHNILISKSPLTAKVQSDGTYVLKGIHRWISGSGFVSFESADTFGGSRAETSAVNVYNWANVHIFDEDNNLLYESSYQAPVIYTISFVTGIEDFTIESVEVHAGDVYNLPEFSYAGYQYMGAFTDETFETAYVGGTEVTGDLTLYLKFEPIVYDVGSTVAEISNRLEGLTYVVLAQSIITSVGVLALFFFRRDSMGV